MEKLSEKMLREADWVEWEPLHSHFVHDVVFLISTEESIFELGEAIAEDNTSLIKEKIDTTKVRRPNGYDVELWRKSKQHFLTLIVSPYVLIQCMSKEAYQKFSAHRQIKLKNL